jgi:hypothetical protein
MKTAVCDAGRDNPRTYSLRTLMLIVTWLAICLRITKEGPGIALPGLIILSLAMLRTISELNLRRGGFAGTTTRQSVVAYLNSVCVVIGSLMVGLAMFIAVALACLVLATKLGDPPWLLALVAFWIPLLSCLTGPVVAIYFLIKTWPRSAGPWRSVVREERWYDHRTGMALPVPPWQLGDDGSDGPVAASQPDRVNGARLVAGDAGRA